MPNPTDRWRRLGSVSNDFVIYTDSTSTDTFDPSWVFSDASVMTVDFGDGTIGSHATGIVHTYAAGGARHRVRFSCPDWTKVLELDINTDLCRQALPSQAAINRLKALLNFYCYTNQFSGVLPSFAINTALVNLYCHDNQFSGYTVGSFATQKNLATLAMATNQLPAVGGINAILADLVVSLGIGGRVVCAVTLNGVGNAAPTGQGIVDKATLIVAWGAGNVLTN